MPTYRLTNNDVQDEPMRHHNWPMGYNWRRPDLINFYSVSALLDGILVLRAIPIFKGSVWNLWTHYDYLLTVGSIWFSLYVLHPIIMLSLPVALYGFIRKKRWVFVLYYVQFPFRCAFVLLSFGFLASLRNYSSFSFRHFFYLALFLEAVRLSFTIRYHLKLRKNA